MWERYEDVVISVGGANSSLGVTSLAPSWPHQGLHVSALSEKWSLCLKGRMDLSDYFLFCFVFSKLRYLGAQRIFAAFRGLFVCPAWLFCVSTVCNVVARRLNPNVTSLLPVAPLPPPLTLPFISPPPFFVHLRIYFILFFLYVHLQLRHMIGWCCTEKPACLHLLLWCVLYFFF